MLWCERAKLHGAGELSSFEERFRRLLRDISCWLRRVQSGCVHMVLECRERRAAREGTESTSSNDRHRPRHWPAVGQLLASRWIKTCAPSKLAAQRGNTPDTCMSCMLVLIMAEERDRGTMHVPVRHTYDLGKLPSLAIPHDDPWSRCE
jgi:hypothetical protein